MDNKLKRGLIIFLLVGLFIVNGCSNRTIQIGDDINSERNESGVLQNNTANDQHNDGTLVDDNYEELDSSDILTETYTAQWLDNNSVTFDYSFYNENDVCVLDLIPKSEVVLYGGQRYSFMLLRVVDDIYYIDRSWTSHYVTPKILIDDFTEDGINEYAIVNQAGVGTECNFFSILFLEIVNGNCMEIEYISDNQKWENWYNQISMEYSDSSNQMLIVYNNEIINEITFTENTHYTLPVGLGFGDIYGYYQDGDDIYHWICVGFLYQEERIISYENEFILVAPVEYENGSFALGEFAIYDGSYSDLIENSFEVSDD